MVLLRHEFKERGVEDILIACEGGLFLFLGNIHLCIQLLLLMILYGFR